MSDKIRCIAVLALSALTYFVAYPSEFQHRSSRLCQNNFSEYPMDGAAANPISFLADAIQITVRPQQKLAVADSGRGIGAAVVFFKSIVRQQFELGFGGDHERPLFLGDEVQLTVGQNG